MLELPEAEEGLLQLLLAAADGLVELVPPAVDVGQGLADGAGLRLGSLLGEVAGLPENFEMKSLA